MNPVEIGRTGEFRDTKHVFGSNWNMKSTGISLGLKTIVGGHVHETRASSPLYLYKNKYEIICVSINIYVF